MMEEGKPSGRKGKRRKRFPATHSRLKGLRGQTLNEAIDYTIASNKWCVSFKDDDGVLVNLVDDCIVCAWLKYISKMVSKICLQFAIVYVTTFSRLRYIRKNNIRSYMYMSTSTLK